MSLRRFPANSRPGTPANGNSPNTNNSTKSNDGCSSSNLGLNNSSAQKGTVGRCFHTTKPQFISSHIERCEACRLKYARKAEMAALSHSNTPRRVSGQQRPRQSLGNPARPTSAASTGPGNISRPASRASVVSRTIDTKRPGHRRSSSAGSPLLSSKSASRRATMAMAALAAAGGGDPMNNMPPLPSAQSSYTHSPTEAMSANSSRKKTPQQQALQQTPRSESPVNLIKSVRNRIGSKGTDNNVRSGKNDVPEGEEEVEIGDALIESLLEQNRNYGKTKGEYETEMARLRDENLRLRHQISLKGSECSSPSSNIFEPDSAASRERALKRTMDLDKAALDKFEEFRKAYEDSETSLRTHRAQFAGERPLSPPPSRKWGSSTRASGDSESRRAAAINAAEVRRAGEDLMSTPVRRTVVPRNLRTSTVRRSGMGRSERSLFSNDSDMSDSESESDEFDEDDHKDLRNCLMSASNFGTFLVQYVNRQCLDYNALCDENKSLITRYDEIEKRAAQLEKQNKRLEESRSEQVAQAYDMSAEREMLTDRIDQAERSNKRLANENDRLRQELNTANERGESLTDQVTKLNENIDKSRLRYEQEIATLRRNANGLQRDKSELSKKNDDLRTELKGKLQRAGLKADNIDEYMAERKKEIETAGTDGDAANADASGRAADSTESPAVSSQMFKRLQDMALYYRKRSDRLTRKLHSEKISHKETTRILHIQQEENDRYQQAFGQLPDDLLGEHSESLAGYIPGMFSGRASRTTSFATDPKSDGKTVPYGSLTDNELSDSPSFMHEDSQQDMILRSILRDARGFSTEPQSEVSDLEGSGKPLPTGMGELSNSLDPRAYDSSESACESAKDNDEDADDRDIRRYQERLRNRRTNLMTPRNRNSLQPKAASSAAGSKTHTAAKGQSGESLGDILGSSTMWNSDKRTPKALSTELGGVNNSEHGSNGPTPKSIRSRRSTLSLSLMDSGKNTPTARRRSRGNPPSALPFSDELGGFGIGFTESTSLAEQFSAAVASANASTPKEAKPAMLDASTSTDPLPTFADAHIETTISSAGCVDTGVQSASEDHAVDVGIATVSLEPGAMCNTGTEAEVSIFSLVESGTQTEAIESCDLGVQATAECIEQQITTDPSVGVSSCLVWAAPEQAHASAQVQTASADANVSTDISVSMAEEKVVDATSPMSGRSTQVYPETAFCSMMTESGLGLVSASTSMDFDQHDRGLQASPSTVTHGVDADHLFGTVDKIIVAEAQLQDRGVDADRVFGTAERSIDAEVEVKGVCVGADGLEHTVETFVETDRCSITDQNTETDHTETVDAAIDTGDMHELQDAGIATDDTMLRAWLGPLVPAEITVDTVIAALNHTGEPVHQIYARLVADAERSAVIAEHQAISDSKVYVNRSVSPELFFATSEQAVQAEPVMTETGVDAPEYPQLSDINVGTESCSVDRWTEGVDPVQMATKSVSAVPDMVDHSVSRETGVSNVGVETRVVIKNSGTQMDTVTRNASTGPVIESRNASVTAGVGPTRELCVDACVGVSEKASGPVCTTVSHSAGPTTESFERSVEAGAGETKTASVGSTVEMADVCIDSGLELAEQSVQAGASLESTAEAHVGPDSMVNIDVQIGPDRPRISNASMSTCVETESICVWTHEDHNSTERFVGTELSELLIDAETQVGPDYVDAAVATTPTSTTTFVDVTTPESTGGMKAAVGEAYTGTESEISDADMHSAQSIRSTSPFVTKAAANNKARNGDSALSPTDSYEHINTPSSVEALSDTEKDNSADDYMAVASFRAVGNDDLLDTARTKRDADNRSGGSEGQTASAGPSLYAGRSNLSLNPAGIYSDSALASGSCDHEAGGLGHHRSLSIEGSTQASGGDENRRADDYGYMLVSPRIQVTHVQNQAVNSNSASISSTGERPFVARDSRSGQAGEPDTADMGRDHGCRDGEGSENPSTESFDSRDGSALGFISPGKDAARHLSMSVGVGTEPMEGRHISRAPEPLIVQAIARTMVGTYMWKYTSTRFTHPGVRERRHMRYFWVHPYSKLLYWSKQTPSGGASLTRSGKQASGNRSVFMRAIRIVEDEFEGSEDAEPIYSVIITTNHREIKIKATTQAEHDVWFIALSYLQSRRIITNTTYPGSSSGDLGDYNSDINSQSFAAPSMGGQANVARYSVSTTDRSSVSHGARGSNLHSRIHAASTGGINGFSLPPLPPPHPGVGTAYVNKSHHMSAPAQGFMGHRSHNSYSASVSSAGMTSPNMAANRGSMAVGGSPNMAPALPPHMQQASRSARHVSVMSPPQSSSVSLGRRLSVGMFKKSPPQWTMQQTIDESVITGGTHMMTMGGYGHQSLASAMAGPADQSPKQMGSPSSGHTVRRMFSGSLLRALRTRESNSAEDIYHGRYK